MFHPLLFCLPFSSPAYRFPVVACNLGSLLQRCNVCLVFFSFPVLTPEKKKRFCEPLIIDGTLLLLKELRKKKKLNDQLFMFCAQQTYGLFSFFNSSCSFPSNVLTGRHSFSHQPFLASWERTIYAWVRICGTNFLFIIWNLKHWENFVRTISINQAHLTLFLAARNCRG